MHDLGAIITPCRCHITALAHVRASTHISGYVVLQMVHRSAVSQFALGHHQLLSVDLLHGIGKQLQDSLGYSSYHYGCCLGD